MENTGNKLEACKKILRDKIDFIPDTALILGSGLGGFAQTLEPRAIVSYKELPGFPVSTVPGHQGRFLFAQAGSRNLMVMDGRVHYYEGYPLSDVVLPIRLMGALGVKTLLLTNAAGGISPSFVPGDLMLITDHITSFFPSPLIGPNEDSLGPRFPDMTQVYDQTLQEKMRRTAGKLGIDLKEGVYLQTTGPNYETPAEIRMFQALGASAVGMSTACEAMVARHMNLQVCGVSCITNLAAGLGDSPLSHEEVKTTADQASARFQSLISAFLQSPEP